MSNQLKSKMLILAYNIHKRHILLTTYFQEKENEILSYNNAILLFALSTGGMICFCVLEVVFYFLYSCKVIKILLFISISIALGVEHFGAIKV